MGTALGVGVSIGVVQAGVTREGGRPQLLLGLEVLACLSVALMIGGLT